MLSKIFSKKQDKEQRYVSMGNIQKREKDGWKTVQKESGKPLQIFNLSGNIDSILMEK